MFIINYETEMEQSRHGEGITSVKVHQQSGGNQTFNIFAQDADADKDRFAKAAAPQVQPAEESKDEGTKPAVQTSVKVHAPPGGKSSIVFG